MDILPNSPREILRHIMPVYVLVARKQACTPRKSAVATVLCGTEIGGLRRRLTPKDRLILGMDVHVGR